MGTVTPFLPLILGQVLDGEALGAVVGFANLMGFFSNLLLGFLADCSRNAHVVVCVALSVGWLIRAFGLFFVRNAVAAGIIFLGSHMLLGGSGSQCDAITLSVLAKSNEPFGKTRLWGAVGWGVSALGTGLLTTYVPGMELRIMLFCPLVFTVIPTVIILLILRAELKAEEAVATAAGKVKIGVLEALRSTPVRWQTICFFVVVYFAGASSNAIYAFLFLHLKTMQASDNLLGLCVALTIVSETPFMFFSEKIYSKIGVFSVMLIACFCYVLRFSCYSLLQPDWVYAVLPIELLHGITFGVFFSSCVSYVGQLAKPEARGTFQGIFSATQTLGQFTGAFGGSFIYEKGGGVLLFRVGAVVMFIVSIIFSLVVYVDRGFVVKPVQIVSIDEKEMNALSLEDEETMEVEDGTLLQESDKDIEK